MKYIFSIFLLLFTILFSSCKKWLDVDPRSVVKEEEIFQDAEGFRTALLGVYTKMASRELYGANLTIGFIDVLAQYYPIESSQHSFYHYNQYEYSVNRNAPDAIWRAAYNAIANCNNILQHIDAKQQLFNPAEFKIIKAEALALRAFLHFDVARLYAPSFNVNPSGYAIPYVNAVSTKPFPQLTVKETLESIEADLIMAAELLKESDPWSQFYDGSAGTLATLPDYLSFRQERMNYYVVLGTLARVNLYMNNKEKAYQYATEVLTARGSGILFHLFTNMSWDNSDLYFNSAVSANAKLIVPQGRKNDYYETALYGSIDSRYKDWFKYYPGSSEEFMSKYMRSIPQNGNPPKIVLMRAEEMSYIKAESASSETEAIAELNKVRAQFGIGAAHKLVPGVADLQDEIMKEYRKTFIGEGQFFFYLKRKNVDPIPYSLITDVQLAYKLPVPELEKEFGNIK